MHTRHSRSGRSRFASATLLTLLGALCAAAPVAVADHPGDALPPSWSEASLRPQGSLPKIEMPGVDVAALLAEDATTAGYEKTLRIGYPMKSDVAPSAAGVWESLPAGDRLWRVRLRSAGALWIKLGFGTFRMGEGGELWVYTPDRSTVLGPFTSGDVRWHGQLWLDPIEGDTLVLELKWPGGVPVVLPNVHLGHVLHGYRPFGDLGKHHTGHDGDSGACNIDTNCPLGDNWQDQTRGVVNLLQGSGQYCSGSLITNTDADCRNYVLTANHCVAGTSGANSTTFQFRYERPGCASGNAPTTLKVTGGTLRATYGPSDMTLLEMDSDPDGSWDAYYSGWSRSATAGTESWGIHHPRGDVKKISRNADPLIDGQNYGPDHWRITEWEDGTTEGGSSGSPLYDQNQRIVGQLHGGTASCSSLTWDEYGKVAVSWNGGGTPGSRLKDWLDPGSSGAVTADGITFASCQVPQPRLAYVSHVLDDALGNGDGIADPGETLVLRVTDLNNGNLDASQVTGTLTTPTGLVTIDDGSAAWPDIPQAQSRESDSPHFTVTLDPALPCGDPVEFDLMMSAAEAPGSWAQAFSIGTGTQQVANVYVDDFESGPNGWFVETPQGSNPWNQSTAFSNSPPTSWFVSDIATVSDSILRMPVQNSLPAGVELTFWHRVNSESNFDGGVLEYSTNGTSWQDAGALITQGGYNSTISTNYSSPIGGRDAWSGDLGGWQQVVADLSTLAGTNLHLRWRFATDSSVSDEGWSVDDVSLDGVSFSCAPVVPGEASAPGEVPFTLETDPGGILLQWSMPVTGAAADGSMLYRHDLATGGPLEPVCEADLGTGVSTVLANLPDGYGYVVVAHNANGEGPYGEESDGTERPPASGPDVCP